MYSSPLRAEAAVSASLTHASSPSDPVATQAHAGLFHGFVASDSSCFRDRASVGWQQEDYAGLRDGAANFESASDTTARGGSPADLHYIGHCL